MTHFDHASTRVRPLGPAGDGTISLSEFCELSQSTGLGKADMRAMFKYKDAGDSGELTYTQMCEVLHEMRRKQLLPVQG
jgi:Ca2+-binding EF-hand superfamily protein